MNRPDILLLGGNGQVGWELRRFLAPLGVLSAPGRAECDLSDAQALRAVVRELRPRLVVNAAAYTAVDRAEDEPGTAHQVNAVAPGVLGEAAAECGAAVVHFSTDYVFDGGKGAPYDEEDAPAPLNVYGRTKLEGERNLAASGAAHLIFRTSWVYSLRGRNFLLAIVQRAADRQRLRVVHDQRGAPTWARSIARGTAEVLASLQGEPPQRLRPVSGVYHLSAAGETSWYGFASAIFEGLGIQAEMEPVPTSGYPTRAPRPQYSVLSNEKVVRAFGCRLPPWDVQLREALERTP